jgi:hypothetical protein
MTQTITKANYVWGTGDVTFDGVQLGGTMGEITITPIKKVHEVTVEQLGDEQPIAAFRSAVGCSVDVPLGEVAFAMLAKYFTEAALYPSPGAPTSLQTGGQQGGEENYGILVLHKTGAGTTRTYDFTLWKAYISKVSAPKMSKDKVREWVVTFKGCADLNRTEGKQLWCWGDNGIGAAPTVTGCSPSNGINTGTTAVTIYGTGFLGVTGVALDTTPATALTSVVIVNDEKMTAVVPSAVVAGSYDVCATNPYGANTESTPEFLVTAP